MPRMKLGKEITNKNYKMSIWIPFKMEYKMEYKMYIHIQWK